MAPTAGSRVSDAEPGTVAYDRDVFQTLLGNHELIRREFRDVEGGCEVEFFVDFEFRNAILQGIIGVVFNDAMQRVVRAFERRAAELHGPKV